MGQGEVHTRVIEFVCNNRGDLITISIYKEEHERILLKWREVMKLPKPLFFFTTTVLSPYCCNGKRLVNTRACLICGMSKPFSCVTILIAMKQPSHLALDAGRERPEPLGPRIRRCMEPDLSFQRGKLLWPWSIASIFFCSCFNPPNACWGACLVLPVSVHI